MLFLDYENAGVYSSALLDAYMDYKHIWSDVHGGRQHLSFSLVISDGSSRVSTAVREVEQGLVQLSKQKLDPHFKKIFDDSVLDYQERWKVFEKELKDHSSVVASRAQADDHLADGPAPEPPMPPFGAICDSDGNIKDGSIAPYDASIFGLENARRDCRFEMIKIVREASPFNYDSSW